LACAWAFYTLLIEELHLEVAKDNIASRMVATQAGFIDTGHRFESEAVVSFAPEVGMTRTMIRYALSHPPPERPRSPDPAP
jgi:RimJ/RimL family protein N-acetyltransferase